MKSNNRAKWAYINEADIRSKIDEGVLDSYDIIYTKDTLLNFIIDENLEVHEIKSKVLTFNSVEEAETNLNDSASTYEGQIVSIKSEDVYRGYIVNKANNGIFYVTPLFAFANVDYNSLGNRPIENKIGTNDSPVDINTLAPGVYKVLGKFIDPIGNQYYSYNGDMFYVGEDSIKKINENSIIDYSNNSENIYVTDKYLKENNYITNAEVDNKIAELNYLTKEEAAVYIQTTLADTVGQMIDEKLDERLVSATEEDIEKMFN